jgi:hypothetical protein
MAGSDCGPSMLSAILEPTAEHGADKDSPRVKLGLEGALPTLFRTMSGTIRRDINDLGNDSFVSSSGDDSPGLSANTGTREKCSVGICICWEKALKINVLYMKRVVFSLRYRLNS